MMTVLTKLVFPRMRSPLFWSAVIACSSASLAVAHMERARAWTHAADRALLGAYAAVTMPLLVYFVVGAVLGSQSLQAANEPLVRFGRTPLSATRVPSTVAVLSSALLAGALAASVAAVGHPFSDPTRWRDLLTSAWVGALGGMAYATWLLAGSSFGRRGRGRLVALVLDWILGSQSGAVALLTPRAHLRNLLGGAPPMDLSERASFTALVVLFFASAGLVLLRTRTAHYAGFRFEAKSPPFA